MTPQVSNWSYLLYVGLPYASLLSLIGFSIYRYNAKGFSVSSTSSQFLENKKHFWSLVPFHYGILWVLFLHMLAIFIPAGIVLWNGNPLRLLILEATGIAAAFLAAYGLARILIRRFENDRLRVVTSRMDMVLYLVLAVQIITGIWVALVHPWGFGWFTSVATPYLWSLFTLQPDATYMVSMPWIFKLHVVNAFIFFALVPFTRMVHALVAPFPYLWRRVQVVRWYPGQ